MAYRCLIRWSGHSQTLSLYGNQEACNKCFSPSGPFALMSATPMVEHECGWMSCSMMIPGLSVAVGGQGPSIDPFMAYVTVTITTLPGGKTKGSLRCTLAKMSSYCVFGCWNCKSKNINLKFYCIPATVIVDNFGWTWLDERIGLKVSSTTSAHISYQVRVIYNASSVSAWLTLWVRLNCDWNYVKLFILGGILVTC